MQISLNTKPKRAAQNFNPSCFALKLNALAIVLAGAATATTAAAAAESSYDYAAIFVWISKSLHCLFQQHICSGTAFHCWFLALIVSHT